MRGLLARIGMRRPARSVAGLGAIALLGALLALIGSRDLIVGADSGAPKTFLVRVQGDWFARSAPFQVALQTMRSQLLTQAGVDRVGVRPVRRDSHAAVLAVSFGGGATQRDEAIARLEHQIDPGPLRVSYAGPSSVLHNARQNTEGDLALLFLALPFAGALLVLAAGPRGAVAAGLAATASAGWAIAACAFVGLFFSVSILAAVGAGAAGLLLSIQHCLFARRGFERSSLMHAGKAASVVFLSLGMLGVGYLSSFALGAAVASLLALPFSMAAMGALRVPVARPRSAGSGRTIWRRLAGIVSFPRAQEGAIAAGSMGLLVLAVLPAAGLQLKALSLPAAPVIGPARALAAAVLAIGALALISWRANRNPRLAVVGALATMLPALGAAGLVVFVFQGPGAGNPLGLGSGHGIYLGSLCCMLAITAAVGAARWVALLSRLATITRGSYFADQDRLDALAASGPPAATTSVIAILGCAALLISSLVFVKQFALGLGLGLALDLIFVRTMLGPALVGALGSPRVTRTPAMGSSLSFRGL